MSPSAEHQGAGTPNGDAHPEATDAGGSITRAVAWVLLPPAILLAPLSAVLLYMVRATGSHEPFHAWIILWTAFDIGAEGNAAVWFASTLWLLVGAFAALAAVTAQRFRKSWWLFAAVGVVASADEAAALHERLFVVGDRLAPYIPVDVHYNWVIPGMAIALVVAAFLLRLVLALRRAVAVSLIASGATFLLGAVVVESVTGLIERREGMSDLYLGLMYVEETLELIGVAWAVIALSSMFRVTRRHGGLAVTFHGFRSAAT